MNSPARRARSPLSRNRIISILCLLSLVLSGGDYTGRANIPLHMEPAFRRPVALVAVDSWLFVANRTSGTISVIDTRDREVIEEIRLSQRIVAMESTPDGRFLVALDREQEQLLLLERNEGRLRIRDRTRVTGAPVTVRVAPGGRLCSVASLWARRITLVNLPTVGTSDLKSFGNRVATSTIDLPFAPREQVYLPDGRHLVVADAFGGNLAVIDTHTARVLRVATVEGHNIRGLAIGHDGQHLLVAQQILDPLSPTTRDRVFWGQVIGNFVRAIDFRQMGLAFGVVVSTAADPTGTGGSALLPDAPGIGHSDVCRTGDLPVKAIGRWRLFPLGQSRNGAGDPGAIQLTSDGRVVVCLSGVGEIAVGSDLVEPLQRLKVGRHPVAVTMDRDGRFAYVANEFGDSIAVIDLELARVAGTIDLGPRRELTGAERGEELFHDATLSLDGWYSCHSCHTDGHSNDQLNDNFSDGSFASPKRVLSLLGAAQTGPWAWDGSVEALRDQVRKSLQSTMQSPEARNETGDDISAITSFLYSLAPPPSLASARGTFESPTLERGAKVFARQNCADCHSPPNYTSGRSYDVGLRDESGQTKFNPPSLQGVSQRNTFFHDGRARRIQDVFKAHRHPRGENISDEEAEDLVKFLLSL